MINPSTIDLRQLPWLPLDEKTAFPKKPAIYFAIDSLGNVQYIGRAKNVRSRWGSHHKYGELNEIGNIKVAYLFVDVPELLPQIETALIEYFDPPLNTVKARLAPTSLSVKIILQQTRRKNGLSQEKLAVASGVSVSYIQKIEQNAISRLSLDILDKLCKTLRCDVSDILMYEEEQS